MDGGMKLRTYRAASIADALADIKRDLGSDAVILHTRTFKAGGVLGLGAASAGDRRVVSLVDVVRHAEPPCPQA